MKIGVLGGTFDPIHNGHLHIALKTRQIFGFSRVYFVVSQNPPHKRSDQISNSLHRFAMAQLGELAEQSLIEDGQQVLL